MIDATRTLETTLRQMLDGGRPPAAPGIATAPLALIGAGSVIARPFVDYALKNLNVAGIIDNPTAGTIRGGLTVLNDEGLRQLIAATPDLVGVTCCCSDRAVEHFDRLWAESNRPLLSLFQAAAMTMGDMAPAYCDPACVGALLDRRDVWESFSDEAGKQAYLSLLLHRLTWDRAWIEPLRLPYKDMYFFTDALAVGDDETLVDGGAFDGDTVELFAQKTAGRYRHIHAFEVDPANLDVLRARVGAVPRVTIHAAGLWRDAGELSLSGGQGAGSSLGGEGGLIVPVVALDDLDLGPVSFIKLDIEGAEIAALQGATETIRRYKPKLSLAVYHTPDDLTGIVDAVRAVRPDYRFTLRHHSPIFHDTVLYAQ
jgi:FkbM family methyltransferase